MTELEQYRTEIDKINNELTKLFVERMSLSGKISEYKKKNSLPVLDEKRESEIIKAQLENVPDNLKEYAEKFYRNLFLLSREYQEVNNG